MRTPLPNSKRPHAKAQNAWRVIGYEPPWNVDGPLRRQFVAYFYFVAWDSISLGLHFCFWNGPNIEVHLPFGFIRIGWSWR